MNRQAAAGREDSRKSLSSGEYVDGILKGDRIVLARAISLIESTRADHQAQAEEVLTQLLPHSGKSVRLGITGVPGVGKSTFINRFGLMLTEKNRRVAVLAVDPTSKASHGSILGDKTRMQDLANAESAFIRPSPTGEYLGGVARKTRESIFLCEAAGFDTVIVETVGVGQSETEVANMVDLFILLMAAGTGDELQGIKRGILELADIVAVNKADSANPGVQLAHAHLTQAFHYLKPKEPDWPTKVLQCSGQTGAGLDEIWEVIEKYFSLMGMDQRIQKNRDRQLKTWLWSLAEEMIRAQFHNDDRVRNLAQKLEEDVCVGKIGAPRAAHLLVNLHQSKP